MCVRVCARAPRARVRVDLHGLFTLQLSYRDAWTRKDRMASDDEVLITSASFIVQRIASIPLIYRQQWLVWLVRVVSGLVGPSTYERATIPSPSTSTSTRNVHPTLLVQHATRRHIVTIWLHYVFQLYLINVTILGIKLWSIEFVFWFSPQYLFETFLILRSI